MRAPSHVPVLFLPIYIYILETHLKGIKKHRNVTATQSAYSRLRRSPARPSGPCPLASLVVRFQGFRSGEILTFRPIYRSARGVRMVPYARPPHSTDTFMTTRALRLRGGRWRNPGLGLVCRTAPNARSTSGTLYIDFRGMGGSGR